MPLNILAWLVSIGIHAAFVIAMFMPAADGAALQEGAGSDIMVVEQGIAIEGLAKLGEDVMSVEAVEAPPMMSAVAQPLEQVEAVEEQEELPVEDIPEVQPVQNAVLTSTTGPESELLEPSEDVLPEPDPDLKEQVDIEPVEEPVQEVTEREPVERILEPVKEPEPDLKEQPLPQQVASVRQETVVAMRESSGEEKTGGSATAHRAYLGKLRVHLERSKVNPRTRLVGTAIVQLTVKSNGQLVSHEIVKSSGSKALDKAALDSIERAAPFPSIPSEVGESTISVSVPFRFTVR
ncbi:TonB family protein [Methyloceanibacter sp.]|uniref:TonB family protein n=1 Tax=Methyloceanibacter sp. TaxID=1965321 RepID=UPI0020869D10|nr:TonB family protein [Methyloceanibacter sp.]GFO81353.1 MAG: TonB family protein [Methyloceanibacter sp.]HML93569.1 TonB family protein [Methyloceanibacter sp.]